MTFKVDALIHTNPAFWRPLRIRMAQEIRTLIRDHGDSRENLVKALSRLRIDGKTIPKKELRKVIDMINLQTDVACPAPPVPLPVPRPSFVPVSAEDFREWSALGNVQQYVFSHWIPYRESIDELLVSYAMLCGVAGGYGDPLLSQVLVAARWKHVSIEDSLRIPLDDRDDSPDTWIFTPSSAQIVLRAICYANSHKRNDFIFHPEIHDSRKRLEQIRNRLEYSYRNFRSQYQDAGHGILPSSWEKFAQLAPAHCVRHGLEPYIATVNRKWPAPIAPSCSSEPIFIEERRHRSLQENARKLPTLDFDPDEQDVMADNSPRYPTLVNDWCNLADLTVKKLLWKLESLAEPTNGRITPSVADAALQLIDELTIKADRFSNGMPSALHLALNWTASRLAACKARKKGIAFTSIEKGLSMVFRSRLFLIPEAVDLSAWEPEDHEAFLQESLEDTRLVLKTRKDLLGLFISIYKLGARLGLTPRVNAKRSGGEVILSSTRARLISPSEVDAIIESLLAMGDRHSRLLAVAILLGFYAGLRSAETITLTLDDFSLIMGEFSLEKQRGKSDSARRRLPLDLLIPARHLETIKAYIEERRNEFEDSLALSKIPLFGAEGRTIHYRYDQLIEPINLILKSWMDSDVVYHSLRHGFVSWLLLRTYALRYPSVLEPCLVQDHALFSEKSQQRLNEYLGDGTPNYQIPLSQVDLLHRLTRLIGHLSPETMFRYYVHTFRIIQRHACRRMAENGPPIILSDKAIEALRPRSSSSATRAKIPFADRTIERFLENWMPPMILDRK